MASKRWIFHWKICPIFGDSVFMKICPMPTEQAFLASVTGLWAQLREFAKKSICGETPYFEAENRYKKSSSGPRASKKGPDPKILLLYFVKLLGPLQAT